MNKGKKIVHNRFHFLETPRKGFIAKMAYLAKLWLILERELVECAPHIIFVV
jgi:hypothetical protein